MQFDAVSFGYAVLKDLFIYIKNKRRRVLDLMDDFKDLETQVTVVRERWKDIDADIESNSAFLEPNNQYTGRKNEVSELENRFHDIKQQYERCSTSFRRSGESQQQRIWTRRFFKLARLDIKCTKLMTRATEILKELPEAEKLTIPKKPDIVLSLKAENLDNVGESHKHHLNKLLEYIEKHNRIGIYGKPEVGITNILKNLNNSFLPSKTSSSSGNSKFDYVIYIRVPRKQSTEQNIIDSIQQEIMERLKLPGKKTTSSANSETISSALSRKKYLLLLDDFRKGIKLEDIGIRKENNKGKVVMAVKGLKELEDVRHDLDAPLIKVKPLLPEESLILFKEFVNVGNTLSVEQTAIAVRILKELGGLPGYIKSIATRLGECPYDVQYWDGVKQRLQSDAGKPELLKLGGLGQFYSDAYGELDEKFKNCLLYVALYPNQYSIPKNILVECWNAENFLMACLETFQEVQCDGAFVCWELGRTGLLELEEDVKMPPITYEEDVKMPPMLRELAISQWYPTASGHGYHSKNDEHVTQEEWDNARWISLMQRNIQELPSSPNCNGLSTLLLQKNPTLMSVRDTFFTWMRSLLVLDLHGTGITSLPSSVSSLTALRCLYLNGCGSLEKLPADISQLQDLQVLDIRKTLIRCLPDGISLLAKFRCLRVSYETESGQFNIRWWLFSAMEDNKLCNLQGLIIHFDREVYEDVVQQVKQKVEAEFKNTLVCQYPRKIKVDIEPSNSGRIRKATIFLFTATAARQQSRNNEEISHHNQFFGNTIPNQFGGERASYKGKDIVQAEQGKRFTETAKRPQALRIREPSETPSNGQCHLDFNINDVEEMETGLEDEGQTSSAQEISFSLNQFDRAAGQDTFGTATTAGPRLAPELQTAS